ncbi:helicase-exonuclease AddAB subunit AddA [Brevibacillus agri]|uniref:helicase-exonuclease AddAB subunit AddA n=1 Tax=Brevibacillus agri TaxID=51101 RepID=UPI002E24A5EF|nr:helicase-exonuclease AddAB subunit AddA [Brevibacillus agri]MED1645611.1 helicase-exonuclease AddAB subunit AddA [Brevibacillus agri]MED1652977.1 helicase-exonuclease AddAB subunit AddA [Brevibacillus agri]MED1687088.1 helicase-exonuclease AddAB subunit AddA [Brevibacillus agri]MED1691710.1 helicase-exonuclease AddAB subunit AddA [Brevibacillus agri]MED1699013.1 helicase-exonuclease AddAB subunit AddA [Brevibacillus agri]
MAKQQVQAKPEQWTDEQWQAIIQRGSNLLVAAAAGSGKTSVLVERIIRRIMDESEPVGVDQLLVVTFTNAAAAEMRHRIGDALRKALKEDPHSAHLRRQLALLQRATITTLHSFCLGILRQYYYLIELDPEFRIADQMEGELLRQDVLEEQLEGWYESDPDFQALADIMLDGQDDQALATLLLRLYEFSRSHPSPERWLAEAADMFDIRAGAGLDGLVWAKSVLRSVELLLVGMAGKLQRAAELAASPEGPAAYLPMLEAEAAALRQAAAACKEGWEAASQAIRGVAFAKLPPVKGTDPEIKEQVQALRNGVKKELAEQIEQYFSMTAEQYAADLQRLAPHMKTLARLVTEFSDAFQLEKRARGIVDFGDLEHLALRILTAADEAGEAVPSPISEQLREQFAEVLVDEYQDINLVQETILRMVSRDGTNGACANRFMVGDVKQSIYRFRLAEPKLFLEKYLTYQKGAAGEQDADDDAPGRRIDLAANFRSRREVVDAVNFLFRQIMSPGVGEIDYDPSAELINRASYPEAEPGRLQAEVHLINRNVEQEAGQEASAEATEEAELAGIPEATGESGEEASVAQLEARLIASRIRRWMEPGEGESPLLVFDKKAGGMRPLAYRDIVILLRATSGWGQTMQEELHAAGIPVYAEQTAGYFAATEVETMLSLLRVIDNPLQDIPLAAVLRSPIVGLREEQLAQIRIQYPTGPFHLAVIQYVKERPPQESWEKRLRQFFAKLEGWRTHARRGALSELLSVLYRETGYLDYVAALENGQQRQANLRALYDRARQYEAGSYRGLFRFLRFVDRLQEAGNDMGEARTIGENEDVVRIMTIHKSKGLEFPVVFVAGMGKQFNTMDLKSQFLLHKDLGFGPMAVEPSIQLRYPSIAALGIRQQLRRDMLAEEMRVLYVALTRAREKLILVGSAKDLAKSVMDWGRQGDGERLSDEDLIQAKGYFDWVGRALLRHPAAGELRAYPAKQGAGEEVRVRTVPDDSVWSFHFHQADELKAQQEAMSDDMALWERATRREEIAERPGDEALRKLVEARLGWTDPHPVASRVAAKWSVSELKRHAKVSKSGQALTLPSITEKPKFLAEQKSHRLTAAEKGTITHLVFQHLDLQRPLDEADIREQVAELAARRFLTEEQVQAVDAGQIATFFADPLGQRMKRAKAVHRELPFTLVLPAHEVEPELGEATSERIIVQGVIDCLLEEDDNRLVLIDFKTDWMAKEASAEAIEEMERRYSGQISLYVRAIRQIIKPSQEVESYLYLLSGGFSIRFT